MYGDTRRNLTMLTDFYELTMMNGFLSSKTARKIAYFDLFFRRVPDGGGFALAAGLEQLIEYLKTLQFTEDDIEYLRGRKLFSTEFLKFLKNFRFTCDVWAIPEGTPIFPQEPVVTVRGPVIEAQLIETMALIIINHQSLIATKTNRVVRAAAGRSVMEFGSRRAQGFDGAVLGARAAYIGGADATACTMADRNFGVPAAGTMAHSWVQMFDSEYDAFSAYAGTYPQNCLLLVDTYNVLKSGVPNAIRVFNEKVVSRGFRPAGIRIDSGDITYLSLKARAMLDAAGFSDCKIVASNSLDEYIIRDMIIQGAKIDSFGVGERLITAASDPVFGGVYKLVAVEENGQIVPKVKLSENVSKLTLPCYKKPWRLYDRASGMAIADVITLADEEIDPQKPYELFDPDHVWKRKTVTGFTARSLQVPIFKGGECVYKSPLTEEIKAYAAKELKKLWDEVKRFENPHKYYVDLSPRLWEKRNTLLGELYARFE
ncbi:MAG: nicotinate phosphoribosyltransferase [Oscillospiraceae bacterium]|jgi:nicotinate phosphoribosyltransferase|nr:nicotinate phosphoribosyltransferase [Oscillospiraceae bacterium]